jgi:hypothetical protein
VAIELAEKLLDVAQAHEGKRRGYCTSAPTNDVTIEAVDPAQPSLEVIERVFRLDAVTIAVMPRISPLPASG